MITEQWDFVTIDNYINNNFLFYIPKEGERIHFVVFNIDKSSPPL